MRATILLPVILLALAGGAVAVSLALRPPSSAPAPRDAAAQAGARDAQVDRASSPEPAPEAPAERVVSDRTEDVPPAAQERPASATGPAPAPTRREQLARNWIEERGRRFADELALAPGAEQRIAAILLETDRRKERLRQDARARGAAADRELLRAAADEIRVWRDAAFEREFGPALGARLVELEEAPVELGGAPAAATGSDVEAGEGPPD